MPRLDSRPVNALRPVRITPNYIKHAEGSVLIEVGDTRVICTASVEDRVPPFRRNSGKGWVTAEYGMLPRATTTRNQREASAGKVGGRTQEIQRLIGRSLRAVTRLEEIGERTIWVDCDVIQADGGTRTASITGAWVALADCIGWMKARNMIKGNVLRDNVAAISCGIYGGTPVLDLDYAEDSIAETDANFVITGSGGLVEVQATAEGSVFTTEELSRLLGLAQKGVEELVALQKALLGLARLFAPVAQLGLDLAAHPVHRFFRLEASFFHDGFGLTLGVAQQPLGFALRPGQLARGEVAADQVPHGNAHSQAQHDVDGNHHLSPIPSQVARHRKAGQRARPVPHSLAPEIRI